MRVASVILAFFAFGAPAPSQAPPIPDRAPRDVLYRLREPHSNATRADVLQSVDAVSDQSLWGETIHKLVLPEGADLDGALATLRADPRLLYAEPNATGRGSYVPDDPRLVEQWAHGQANDADIDSQEAWDLARDASSVVVAIIDSGIDTTHPDLIANLWTNPGEVPGNGVDDDGNGWIDDVHGIDTVDLDGDPQDGLGHGTHVGGIVGAVGDNGIGVAGVCHRVQIMPLRFINDSNFGWYSDAILCLNYAVAHGVRISNHSWGGTSFSQALLDAIHLAGAGGQLLTCAAMNTSSDDDASPYYPASYDAANIITVAATNSSDSISGFSNYGATSVDLGAPGESILSTWPGGQYAYADGTSMAAPHVAGVAALLLASVPAASPAALKSWILRSVDPLQSLQGKCVTGGRLNFARALVQLPFAPTDRVSVDSSGAQGNGWSNSPAISADGRFVAFFSSASNLVAYDANGVDDVFVRDRFTGSTERVSVDSSGAEGNGASQGAAISADGRFVAFSSLASNLVGGDQNGTWDVFIHDRSTGATERVSISSSGTEGDGSSLAAKAIASDGRVVAFVSGATDLVAGDTNGQWDVFVRDRVGGTTERVSVDSSGAEANSFSGGPSLSADGRIVALWSAASNLVSGDTNAVWDVFVHDRSTGVTQRVSVDSSGAEGNQPSYFPSISADGQLVAYSSLASNLVSGDANGFSDVFVHDRSSASTVRVSVDSSGGEAVGGDSTSPSISADGRLVVFQSLAENLADFDTNATPDIFAHDRATGRTDRRSVNSAGVQSTEGPDGQGANDPQVSADGRFVAFESDAANLVVNDTNGYGDIFVHGPYLAFHVAPTVVSAGETLSLAMWRGESSGPMMLVATALNGVPLFLLDLLSFCDADGLWTLAATVPAGLSGNDITFATFAIVPNATLERSNPVTVDFR